LTKIVITIQSCQEETILVNKEIHQLELVTNNFLSETNPRDLADAMMQVARSHLGPIPSKG
jgi:hypothetical protein